MILTLLDLGFTFLLIGATAFGGGYGMIPLVRSIVVDKGWLTVEEVSHVIAISEATPGPIAINMATYVGKIVGGFWGSLIATIMVVLPAFLILLLLAKVLKKFKENKYVAAFLNGVKPVIMALIFCTGLVMVIQCFYVNFGNFNQPIKFDWVSLVFVSCLIVMEAIYFKIKKKPISPILLIAICAIVGMLVF